MKGTRHAYRQKRRMQKMRRRVTAFGVAAIAMVILASALSAIQVHADTSEETKRYKYFTSVFVERDDTLWGLAAEYRTEEYADVRDYVDEVMAINHLTEEQLQYGDWITVPYYSSDLK